MDVKIKSLKIMQSLSEETLCFTCSIWVDKKKIGEASNRGCGGPNDYHWADREAGKALEDWADKQELEFDFERLDQIIDKLVADEDELRWKKRQCKGKILFRLKGDKPDMWRVIKRPFSPVVDAMLVAKHGDKLETIMNRDI